MSSCDCCDDKSGEDEPNTEMEVSDSDQVNEGNVVAQVDETLALAASMKENGNASLQSCHTPKRCRNLRRESLDEPTDRSG